MAEQPLDTLIFDVGGVLVELSGVEQMLAWCGGKLSEPELWSRWLSSPAVRAFEAGRSSTEDFGAAAVHEFALRISPADFLSAFARWPSRLYPGAADLLRSLAPRYRLVSLSNTNLLHWQYVCADLGLGKLFERHFPSHETGMMKPDREVFDFVVRSLGGEAGHMVFLDDNQLNVDAARSAGLPAYRVAGVRGVSAQLQNLGIAVPNSYSTFEPGASDDERC